MYPTGILHNTATDRFHPISFRPAPMPGGSEIPRYKSLGHHTDGFDTLDQAKAWIGEQTAAGKTTDHSHRLWEWDGNGIPALVEFF